jgi:hypothetical protein
VAAAGTRVRVQGGLELLLVERRDHLGVRAREEEIAGDLGGAVAPEKKGEGEKRALTREPG